MIDSLKLFKTLIISSLLTTTSCGFLFNKREIPVSISSNPPGADIVIEGRKFGVTPATLKMKPANYKVTLQKPGYGSANFAIESWQKLREGADGQRCLLDALGTMLVLPLFSVYSVYCRDFKEKEHFITINQDPSMFRSQPRPQSPYLDYYNQNNYNPYSSEEFYSNQPFNQAPKEPNFRSEIGQMPNPYQNMNQQPQNPYNNPQIPNNPMQDMDRFYQEDMQQMNKIDTQTKNMGLIDDYQRYQGM